MRNNFRTNSGASGNGLGGAFDAGVVDFDTYIVAPETDGILEKCASLLRCPFLGSKPNAIRLCADKLKTYEIAKENGILTPKTYLSHDKIDIAPPSIITKPDGVGCDGIRLTDKIPTQNGVIIQEYNIFCVSF